MRVLVVGLGLIVACDSPRSLDYLSVKLEMSSQAGELSILADTFDYFRYKPVDDPNLRIAVRVRDEEIGLAKAYVESSYEATRIIDPPLAGDEEVVVIIDQRDGEYIELSATAPPSFTVSPPTDAHASQPITVMWSPTSNDPMGWRGTCLDEEDNGPIPANTGSITFPTGIVARDRCSAQMTFSRSRTSRPHSELSSAELTLSQAFPVTFEVAP